MLGVVVYQYIEDNNMPRKQASSAKANNQTDNWWRDYLMY
jgi:hypothetical protein